MKGQHRRRRVGPQTECASQLSRAKTCASRVPHWLHSHPQPARWVNFGFFAKACHGKSFCSGFLLFLEQQGTHEYYSLTNIQRHATLPSTTSDRQRARLKRKNMCKSNGVTRWRELESTYFVTSIYARNTGTWAFFFERRFQPLSVGGVFSNQRESISRCPKSPFPSKTQNRQIAPNFSLNPFACVNGKIDRVRSMGFEAPRLCFHLLHGNKIAHEASH